jgi:hypothetical protein
MGKKLAILGHPTRGKEVMELLTMMGGHAAFINVYSNNSDKAFFISDYENCFYRKSIRFIPDSSKEMEDFNVFTLEEFLEKFPYKVGDVIKFPNNMAEKIAEMKWDEELEDIIYTSVSGWTRPCHVPKNKEEKKINQMSLANCDLDEVEIVLGDKFELKIEDGKYYAVRKKLTYPTTYDECCDILNIETNRIIDYDDCLGYRDITQYDTKLLTQLRCLRKIRICRDAYWKIAGEQMGLGKPWKADFTQGSGIKYIILFANGGVIWNRQECETVTGSRVLAFPTAEMRDTFYENFKNEIEQCKELL